ncbi:Type 1 glutamine amidotransferase-like domain-containing protein [Bacillus sp. ISL-39]|uniref:Type 1 glutamine amidotransferase-like domain-containing protein n=1 Tax=Bacillus sp. ISL-39 TaxID=2819124 RepID=UPI001BEB3186|nr:Type 1 glutamine amidotransferase-like domain-containing protein [Bacillus sp. ISL-39]MBT2636927.1 Type 1 glutamine amidotransferase-like domain-containing protein [Bacillus sp. ISL-39]
MRRLVLLSDLRNMNHTLISKIKNVIGGQSFRLAYIPSRTDKERWYFEKAKPEFSKLGITDFFYFDVDEDFELSQLEEFISCDAIFLSGGNTYHFLKNLKEQNIVKYIKKMVDEGKPLIGVSAGSIIMSKLIKIAAFHDENEVQLNELSGLGLVDFEFMPHWNRESDQLDELLKYSLIQEESIFTCDDGDGIVIEGDEIEFYGHIKEIRKGALL